MEEVLSKIIGIEWEMFDATQNRGGRAWCQNDKEQFIVMRRSQFMGWDEGTAALYLNDLRDAKAAGINLVAVKYANMMENTHPAEFAAIAASLPEVSVQRRALADALTAQTVEWCEEFAAQYPVLASFGRPIYSIQDGRGTSVETYSHGEFLTYGEKTLRSLLEHYKSLKAAGRNLHREVVENEVKLMGYKTLEEAEERMKNPK